MHVGWGAKKSPTNTFGGKRRLDTVVPGIHKGGFWGHQGGLGGTLSGGMGSATVASGCASWREGTGKIGGGRAGGRGEVRGREGWGVGERCGRAGGRAGGRGAERGGRGTYMQMAPVVTTCCTDVGPPPSIASTINACGPWEQSVSCPENQIRADDQSLGVLKLRMATYVFLYQRHPLQDA